MSYTSSGIDIQATVERVRGLPAEWYAARPIPAGLIAAIGHDTYRPLSPRQVQVLTMYAAGMPGPAIALCLGISTSTVTRHRSTALSRLHARNLTHAVAKAIRLELVRPPPA